MHAHTHTHTHTHARTHVHTQAIEGAEEVALGNCSYRSTIKLVTEGAYEFWNWFDFESWHPLGRVVGGTVFPGLMFTAAAIYKVCFLGCNLFSSLPQE